MPVISDRDNENNRWKRNTKKQTNKQIKTEKSKGERSYSQKVRAKWFMCAFKISPVNV